MLKLNVLPAGHGDCLLLEYGDPARCVLIDGGARGTYKRALQSRLAGRELELLVVTHVDADHIAGVLEGSSELRAKEVWFNGYRHLPGEWPEMLGPVQGEKLTAFLKQSKMPWNRAFDGGPVVVPADGELPRFELGAGLAVTLLLPAMAGLAALKPQWEAEVRRAGLVLGVEAAAEESTGEFALLNAAAIDVAALSLSPFIEDDAVANGSSIALLVEFQGCRVLLASDAHPRALVAALRRLPAMRWSACKLPHHGSKLNVSRELLELMDCNQYIFSTSGAHFRHPDREAVARVVTYGGAGAELLFNYRSPYTTIWENKALKEQYRYKTRFPADAAGGLQLIFP